MIDVLHPIEPEILEGRREGRRRILDLDRIAALDRGQDDLHAGQRQRLDRRCVQPKRMIAGYAVADLLEKGLGCRDFEHLRQLHCGDFDSAIHRGNPLAKDNERCDMTYRALTARIGAAPCAWPLASPSQASMMPSAICESAHCRITAPRSKAARGMP